MPETRPHQPFWKSAALTTALVFIVGFTSGFLIERQAVHRGASNALVGEIAPPAGVDLSPVWKAWNIIDTNFVPAAVATSSPIATTTAARNQDRVWGLIQGMAGSLNDPYTFFLPPVENTSFAQDMSGAFEGVGMEIAVKNEVLTVVSPLKGTPSEKAGIKAGDLILKIDGADTKGLDVGAAVKKIRGPKGTTVILYVFRTGWKEPKEISVVRDVINVPIVNTKKRDDGIFVISVAQFTSNSPDLFRNALREFVQSGNTKLILDLRGNPGGYLEAAVDMASWFLPSGRIVVTEDYAGHENNVIHRSLGYDIFNKNLKMVILVDKGSASASEILADALRYWKIGKLVGTDTFGKGVVQELFDITPETSLKVTVARWLGPDGQQIPLTGLIPDVMATTTDEAIKAGDDPQMEKAAELFK
ncbi:S41 family peptidase [Candidatus Kaiserbacteria bacterium]|nr:S41 family peptidase [Candidatus Kaiserbacteria bacterium]